MQNMFRRHGLVRRFVALITAVLLLSGEAQVFLQTPFAVMAVDNDDAADVSGNVADREGLTLTVSEVQDLGTKGIATYDSYEYGGRVPVKFTITDADGVKL